MQLKDYYRILDIKPSAGFPEIRKAYRKLAMQYHPDKNPDDAYAAAKFASIREAYEILTHPSKKEKYLQQRWYQQSAGKRKTQDIITPVTVLSQLLELDKFVHALDINRMDKQGLAEYLGDILSDETISQLTGFHEPAVSEQIIFVALRAMEPLQSRQVSPIAGRLLKLAVGENAASRERISESLARKKQKEKAEKYRPFILLVIVIVLCLLIWLMGR
jgi:molecular chaperone DnaJ